MFLETDLSTDLPDSIVNIPEYNLFRRDRGWLGRDKRKNRRLVRACDYCGDVQVKNMEIEHLWNILLEGAPYMKKYEN